MYNKHMCDLRCRMSGSKNEHQLEYTTDNFNEVGYFCFVFMAGFVCVALAELELGLWARLLLKIMQTESS